MVVVTALIFIPPIAAVTITTGTNLTVTTGTAVSTAASGTIIAISTPVAIAAGVLVVGASTDGITWDCWKQVVHDSSVEASSGMELS